MKLHRIQMIMTVLLVMIISLSCVHAYNETRNRFFLSSLITGSRPARRPIKYFGLVSILRAVREILFFSFQPGSFGPSFVTLPKSITSERWLDAPRAAVTISKRYDLDGSISLTNQHAGGVSNFVFVLHSGPSQSF